MGGQQLVSRKKFYQFDVSFKRSKVFLIANMNDRVRIGIFSSLADEIDEFDELIEIDGKISRCCINSSCCIIKDGIRI
jgi:hypothetical protein